MRESIAGEQVRKETSIGEMKKKNVRGRLRRSVMPVRLAVYRFVRHCLLLCDLATKRVQDILCACSRCLEERVDAFLDVFAHLGDFVLEGV